MAKGSQQTNRWLGDLTMALHQDRPAANLPPVPWTLGGSQNHRGEGASVSFKAHDRGPLGVKALKQALERMRAQATVYGHGQVGAGDTELLTDSHNPIWVRFMASLHLTAWERRDRSSGNAELYRLTLAWWGEETWLCERLLVPRGPNAGQVWGVGARFAFGRNEVRDITHALLTGRQLPRVGAKLWQNALRFQDTFGLILVREMVQRGATEGMQQRAPWLPFEYTITRYEGGHTSETSDDFQHDDPHRLTIRYEDGATFTNGDGGEVADLGRTLESVQAGKEAA